jgi:Domain of unknown function (DUF4157)
VSEFRRRDSSGAPDRSGAGAQPRSPIAQLQRSLGNQRLLQLRRAVQQRAWARDQLGVTAEDEANVDRADAADAATSDLPGGGAPLDPAIQARAEASMGALGDVRVIQNADAVCAPMEAHAFASGNEVYLSSGVDLASPDGQFTLMHELAHVRQQQDGKTAGLEGLGGDGQLRDSLESHADDVARKVLG